MAAGGLVGGLKKGTILSIVRKRAFLSLGSRTSFRNGTTNTSNGTTGAMGKTQPNQRLGRFDEAFFCKYTFTDQVSVLVSVLLPFLVVVRRVDCILLHCFLFCSMRCNIVRCEVKYSKIYIIDTRTDTNLCYTEWLDSVAAQTSWQRTRFRV